MTSAADKTEQNGEHADTPPEPTDDLVTTSHEVEAGGRTLRYTAVTGRIVLRKETITDGAFDGHQAKA